MFYRANPNIHVNRQQKPFGGMTRKKFFIALIVWAVLTGVIWYIQIPALSLFSPDILLWAAIFYVLFKILQLGAIGELNQPGSLAEILFSKNQQPNTAAKIFFWLARITAVGAFLWVFVSPIICGPIFHAKEFANRIQIQNVEFEEIAEVDFTKTPIIDRESTEVLGDRVMGRMPELVSQFEVSDEYTQISYRNSVYRVTPLEYAGFIKYLGNKEQGIPAYILVNSVTGEAELVKLKDLGLDGMKYVPSGYFNQNLYRQLQIQYPTTIFGSPSFEIDDEGHPWYVCTTYTYAGYLTKRQVTGVVLFDPITGDSTKYSVDKAPTWVDRIYPESLVMQEVDNNGSLKDGWLNSKLGQKNVTVTSEGYNYLEQNGDIYIYSGITSANGDSSNLGFVLVNLRTHEAMKIASAGANEYSAMRSAEGEVKNYGYNSTFPLLVNVKGKPVYMMALKDDNGLIKMYAMVDATNYQKVATIESDEGFETLKKKFIGTKADEDEDSGETQTKDITVAEVQILIVENKSKCFITDDQGNRYKLTVSAKNEDVVAFLKNGDTVTIEYTPYEDVSIIKTIAYPQNEETDSES